MKMSKHDIQEMENAAKKEVDAATAACVKDGEAPLDLVYTDVYLNTPNLSIRGTNPFTYIQPKFQTSSELLEALKK